MKSLQPLHSSRTDGCAPSVASNLRDVPHISTLLHNYANVTLWITLLEFSVYLAKGVQNVFSLIGSSPWCVQLFSKGNVVFINFSHFVLVKRKWLSYTKKPSSVLVSHELFRKFWPDQVLLTVV